MTDVPEIRICSDGWLFRKTMLFRRAGCTMEGHAHAWPHFTMLFAGALDVEVNGKVTRFESTLERPVVDIWIEAGHVHTLRAARPMTMAACLHALHDPRDREKIFDASAVPAGIPSFSLAAPLIR